MYSSGTGLKKDLTSLSLLSAAIISGLAGFAVLLLMTDITARLLAMAFLYSVFLVAASYVTYQPRLQKASFSALAAGFNWALVLVGLVSFGVALLPAALLWLIATLYRKGPYTALAQDGALGFALGLVCVVSVITLVPHG